jgi:hypothetical protein
MSESGQRLRIIRALKPFDARAIENPLRGGTPDVNYTHGWIELKWLRSWPKREETPIRLPHFHVGQRLWLKQRWRCRGLAFLLLQCNKEWLLFRAPEAAEHVGHLSREQLYDLSLARWDNGLNNKELQEWLTKSWEELDHSPLGKFYSSTGKGATKAKERRRGG